MDEKRYRAQKFEIETISPLHIGNGNEWSPFFDYLYEDNTVNLINFDKLFGDINNIRLINEYSKRVKLYGSQYPLRNFIDEFLAKRSDIDYKKYITKKVILGVLVPAIIIGAGIYYLYFVKETEDFANASKEVTTQLSQQECAVLGWYHPNNHTPATQGLSRYQKKIISA